MYCIHIWWILQEFFQLFNRLELLLTIWKIHKSLICFPPGSAFDCELHLEGPYPTVKSARGQRAPVRSHCRDGTYTDPTEMHSSAQFHTPPGAPVSCLWGWRQWDHLLGIKLSTRIIQNQSQDACIYSTESKNTNGLNFQIKLSNLLSKNIWDKVLMINFSSWDFLGETFP